MASTLRGSSKSGGFDCRRSQAEQPAAFKAPPSENGVCARIFGTKSGFLGPKKDQTFWGEELWRKASSNVGRKDAAVYEYMEKRASAQERLEALATAIDQLTASFSCIRSTTRSPAFRCPSPRAAVVEFGDKVKASAVTAGGQSGDPSSPHFNDQAQRYASGGLREVYFYPEQLKGHTERTYHPGP